MHAIRIKIIQVTCPSNKLWHHISLVRFVLVRLHRGHTCLKYLYLMSHSPLALYPSSDVYSSVQYIVLYSSRFYWFSHLSSLSWGLLSSGYLSEYFSCTLDSITVPTRKRKLRYFIAFLQCAHLLHPLSIHVIIYLSLLFLLSYLLYLLHGAKWLFWCLAHSTFEFCHSPSIHSETNEIKFRCLN